MIKFKKLHQDAKVPTRGSDGAAGFDLHALGEPADPIRPGQRAMIGTGIAAAIPPGFVGLVRPRSGLAVRQGLDIMAGVIDQDYRGEIQVLLVNHGAVDCFPEDGQRIAQLVVVPYVTEAVEVEDLDATERGYSGFGSTGK